MYGINGKTNVTNGSNGLYRLSEQRAWAIKCKNSVCVEKRRMRVKIDIICVRDSRPYWIGRVIV